jgi:enamine deaminase RidA (YjgF/YER057c/UK114 family)
MSSDKRAIRTDQAPNDHAALTRSAMSEAYASHFNDPRSARSSVVLTRLKNPDVLVEIEAIAVVG